MLAGMQRCVLGIQDPDEPRTTTLPWGRTKRRIALSGRCKKTISRVNISSDFG